MQTVKVKKINLHHKPGADVVAILANAINSDSLGAIREAVSNSIDAHSKKVEIQVNRQEIIVEDWGSGIEDTTDFVEYGSHRKLRIFLEKVKRGRVPIGQFHLGKLSYFKLSDTVHFYTNSGKKGYKIDMHLYKQPNFEIEQVEPADAALSHRGTKIIIKNPKIDNQQEYIDRLWKYLSKSFGLKVLKGFKLRLGYRAITVNPLEFGKESRIAVFGKNRSEITGNIKKGGSGIIDVYCRDIFITPVLLDPDRDFSGWVNCDALTPVVGRNEFDQDTAEYKQFVKTLKEYVQNNFDKRDLSVTRSFTKANNFYDRIIAKYLKELGLSLRGGTGSSSSEKEKREEGTSHGTAQPKNTGRTRMANKTRRSRSGLIWKPVSYGNGRPPFILEYPWLLCNITNDLTKFCFKPYRRQAWGSVEQRLMPFMARIMVEMREEHGKWSYDELTTEIDKANRFVLSNLVSPAELSGASS